MGLQLEAQQRALARHLKDVGAHETVDQGRRRIERETKLRRKIDAWMAVQQLFIAEVAVLRAREDVERKRVAATQPLPGMRTQDMKLWLPSAIGCAQCDDSLREYEHQLRKGQAVAAPKEMRDQLLLRTPEYQYKDSGLSGVRAKTRSATRTKGIQARIDSAVEDYRAARAVLVKLSAVLKRTEWQLHFKQLKAEDRAARGLTRTSWTTGRYGLNGRRHAKAMRYREEVDLLEEEMRRVLHFLGWRRVVALAGGLAGGASGRRFA
ncbi:hypothetical protein DFH09DRAFT_1305365 [Mycena vulgaris]|nr:hypothetical protein DFH09DRAFT_1305365 [Mycena vulgaris]